MELDTPIRSYLTHTLLPPPAPGRCESTDTLASHVLPVVCDAQKFYSVHADRLLSMEGLPANLSERDVRIHSRLAPVVKRLWCRAINYCNGSYGGVVVGALQAKSSEVVRSGLLTTKSTSASWQPGTVRCWRLHILPVIEALHEVGFHTQDRPRSTSSALASSWATACTSTAGTFRTPG